MECGLSCARSCRDLSRDIKCSEECVAGCRCPNGQLLNDENRCVPVSECPCLYDDQVIQPGNSVSVGNCKTWYVFLTRCRYSEYCIEFELRVVKYFRSKCSE